MKTFTVIHGWAEGPWQSKLLRKSMSERGYEYTKDIRHADVIFAHSLGCYLVPRENKAQLIVLVGLPYWPGRSALTSLGLKLRDELRGHRRDRSLSWWLNKMAHNTANIIFKPQLTYYGISKASLKFLPKSTLKRKIILTLPKADTFCEPQAAKELAASNKYTFAEIPGAHDDCWFTPEPYVDLIIKEL